ncbi:hypothetical protein BC829DRAFT_105036 [Chytridium lagenaria]|nr:hypothetical protein BC829DRAFT_105036 [Chytridium lagenaria]
MPSNRPDSVNDYAHPYTNGDASANEFMVLLLETCPILKRPRTTSPVGDDGRTFPERYSSLSMAATEITETSVLPACGSIVPASVPRPAACIFYQGGQCDGSVCGINSPHVCIRCHEAHPAILCKKDRNVCVKWNMDDCGPVCHREHRCLRCASLDHTLRNCPMRPINTAEYCFAWNSAGTCRIVDCRRQHECIRCGTSHPAIICPENLDQYLLEYLGRCRADNFPADELAHLELLINRRSAMTAAAGASLSVSTSSSAPPPQVSSRSNGVQPHPLHLAAAAALRVGGSGGIGGLVGIPDPDRASKRVRSDDPHAMILTGFRTTHGSLLSDVERKQICRDYNNFKCEVDDSRCRFKHACLRCGMTDHRERNCLVHDSS